MKSASYKCNLKIFIQLFDRSITKTNDTIRHRSPDFSWTKIEYHVTEDSKNEYYHSYEFEFNVLSEPLLKEMIDVILHYSRIEDDEKLHLILLSLSFMPIFPLTELELSHCEGCIRSDYFTRKKIYHVAHGVDHTLFAYRLERGDLSLAFNMGSSPGADCPKVRCHYTLKITSPKDDVISLDTMDLNHAYWITAYRKIRGFISNNMYKGKHRSYIKDRRVVLDILSEFEELFSHLLKTEV